MSRTFLRHCATAHLLPLLIGVCVLTLTGAPVVRASDELITITCTQANTCQQVTGPETWFSQTNAVPGQSQTRSIQINNRRVVDGCQLAVSAKNTTETVFAEQLIVEIKTSGVPVLQTTLSQLLQTETPLYFDTIDPQTEQTYDWKLTFSPTADNTHQGSELYFDLDTIITCADDIRKPTPLPTPPPTIAPPTQTPCTTTPPTPPTGLRVVQLDHPKEAQLRWKSDPHATGYVLTYVTTDGSLRYENIALPPTAEYTLRELHPRKTYRISMRTQEDCAISATSQEVLLVRTTETETTPIVTSSQDTAQTPTPTDNPEDSVRGSVLGVEFDQTASASPTVLTTVTRALTSTHVPLILLALCLLYGLFRLGYAHFRH